MNTTPLRTRIEALANVKIQTDSYKPRGGNDPCEGQAHAYAADSVKSKWGNFLKPGTDPNEVKPQAERVGYGSCHGGKTRAQAVYAALLRLAVDLKVFDHLTTSEREAINRANSADFDARTRH